MKFIKRKIEGTEKVEYKISKRTKCIIDYYAKFTNRTESYIVDQFMINVLDDKEYNAWLRSQRFNKKINEIIFNNNNEKTNESD